ncbi:acyl--CoA ligase [Bradyrhizobium sp. 138]|uniref:class I adenylate-forming enzyme family protein n=1 Tax=Bradyrhizobium sp. 138 TaxID=2782615 RepID=UPI001FFAA0DB|nr:class I adenylate-forming enzyme family protein [Bradyrhizobium sp. 138]MCK1735700.1 acyl--CoA ligase [Bradyrhizobium sp. 138]
MSGLSAETHLGDRVAKMVSKIKELEEKYETTTVGELISKRARTHASTIAVDVFDRNERATYLEIHQLSNKYGHALRTFGVRKGDRIGVMLSNRIEFPIIWFAIAKIGAVIVPINMRYTPREIEYVLSETQATYAVVENRAWPVFAAMQPWPRQLDTQRILLVEKASDGAAASLDQLLQGIEESDLKEDVCPNDLLNIQFTSGTTGFPKGCMLTHDYWGVSSYQWACWDGQLYRRHLSAQPFFYIDPQWHLLSAYRQGGTFYLAPQVSSTRFLGWVRQHRIEWCQFPELVAREAEAADENGTTCLKRTINWGWNPNTVRQFRERFRVPTQDAYGMTEIGFGTRMAVELDEFAESGSVGIPVPFRSLRLMNEDGSATAVGEVGELWVSGRGIFKGYWNKPEANAAQFEGNWFKTGDLMRRDEIGFYWLVGRKKDMIRRSGENIAAREIEAVIREIPEISDVAAVPVHDAKRGEEVKICVELKQGLPPGALSVERILQHARSKLAVFKVPRYIAFIAELPRTTSSNKVLKRELMNVSDQLSGAYDAEQKRWR